MNLKIWIATQPRGVQLKLAQALEVTPTWVSLIAAGKRKCSVELAIAIERETGGSVTRQELRPDVFQ